MKTSFYQRMVVALCVILGPSPLSAAPQSESELALSAPPGAARCIAWQPGGALIATSGDDTAVQIWRADGTLQSIGLGHSKSVRALAWSGDGQILASRGGDSTIRLWNPASGQELAAFKAPSGLANALVWSANGELIADGPDYSIRVLNAATGKERLSLKGHRKWVRALAMAPDGKRLASAGGDGDVRIWNWPGGVSERVLSVSDGQLRGGEWLECVAWSRDGRWLAAGGDDGQIRIWDARDGRLLKSLALGSEVIQTLNWDASQTLHAAGDKGGVRAWNLAADEPEKWQLPAGWQPLTWHDEALIASDEGSATRFFDAPGADGLTLRADTDQPFLRAARWHREGVKLRGEGRYAEAVSMLRRAHELAPETWTYAISLSWALNNAQQFEASRDLLQSELLRAPDSHARRELKRQLAYTHNFWGNFLRARGEWPAAIAQHEAELQQALHIGDAREADFACTRIADNLESLDQAENALPFRWRALDYSRKTGDAAAEASALRSLGDSYLDLDHYAETLRAFWQSHALYLKAGGADEIGASFNQLGLAYYQLGDYSRALRLYERALEKQRPSFNFSDEATTMGNVALIYLKIGRPDMAAQQYRRALEVARRAQNRGTESFALSGLAEALARLERFPEAKRLAVEAVAIEAARGDRSRKIWRLHRLAGVLLAAGEARAALSPLHEALWLARQTQSRAGEARVAGALMATWRALEQPELAIFYGKRAVNLRQNIRSGLRSLDADLQSRYARTSESEYRALADLLIARGRLAEAGEVLGLLKQQEFLDFVRRDVSAAPDSGHSTLDGVEGATAGDEAALWASVTLLSEEKKRLGNLAERSFAQTERLEKVGAELKSFEARYVAFLAQLPARFAVAEAPTRDLKGEFAAIQNSLNALAKPAPRGAGIKAAAIYTLVTPDRVRVIFVGPYGAPVPLSHPIKSDELNRKVFAFHRAIAAREPVESLAQELYQILFCDGQLEKQLRASGVQTLMWSLDGSLRYLPLGALHDGKGWLVERYAQSTFSAASLSRLEAAPAPDWTVLGLGVSGAQTVKLAPYEPESFAALPGVLNELRGIVRTPKKGWSGGALEGEVLTDDAFDFRALKAGLTKERPVLHIATHFRLRARNAESYLLLGAGQPLTLDKLAELGDGTDKPFGAVDLVAFSACQTALGGDAISRGGANGAEVDSLGTLAQEQGARAVMATLWSVSDASTSTLMQKFYTLREGEVTLSKTEALRRAQLALLRGTDASAATAERGAPRLEGAGTARWSHPYYWAPFVLIGNWR